MRLRHLGALVGALIFLGSLVSDVVAQRRDRDGERYRDRAEWVLLGEKAVGFGIDRDLINVGQSEAWFRDRAFKALHFLAEHNAIHMMAVRVVYLNGYAEDFRVDKRVRAGEELLVDLRGERSYLKQVEMIYRSRPRFSGQAVIKVYGEPARRFPRETAGWDELDTKRFDRRDERVVLGIGRAEGRLGQIRLRALDGPVHLIDAQIRFRNGESQAVELHQTLEAGEQTRALDLEGDQRRVETIVVSLRPGRHPGEAGLQLLGLERPGRPESGAGLDSDWLLLGEQRVGFQVDRDVINIGQAEEWFRTRSFRTLHFMAERNDVHMMAARLVYLNGYAEDLRIDKLIRAGERLPVDLRGERSYLKDIELTYRSRPDFRGQAVLKVYGEPVRLGRP
jgi:hypothetical protein